MSINGLVNKSRYNENTTYFDKMDEIAEIAKNKGNNFISDVISSITRYGRCSDKQAYCVAKFATDNGYKFYK